MRIALRSSSLVKAYLSVITKQTAKKPRKKDDSNEISTIDDVGFAVAVLPENEVDGGGGVGKDFVLVGLEVLNDDLLDAHEM